MQGATHFTRQAPLSWRPALIALLCVTMLHIGLYAVLRGSSGWKPRQATPAARAPVTLRLLPWRAPVAVPAPAEPRATPKPSATPRSEPAAFRLAAPSAVTPSTAAPAAAQAAAAEPPALPASRPPGPLDLTLPRGVATRPGTRNPALDGPRSNSARPATPEGRMAASFDTRVIEEDFGEGRRRFRQGDNCVIVTPSRITRLMPFNEAAARTPSVVSACP